MADHPKKNRASNFAEKQLLRHGWEHGKGLGRAQNGISEAIKVKVKCDKGGVGHKEGEQFTFQWWDHVFNKASSSLEVESDQNGIQFKKTVQDDGDGVISNKKNWRAAETKTKLYGFFVKSATLLSGQEQPVQKSSLSDDDSSSDEDNLGLDLSSTTKLSDADLMKVCGGRTAHKGARHGLNMSAKLARLEQQEAEFMAKYGKQSKHSSSSMAYDKQAPTQGSSLSELPEEMAENTLKPDVKFRQKSKHAKTNDIFSQNGVALENSEIVVCQTRKRKQKSKISTEHHEEEKLLPAGKKGKSMGKC